MLIARIRSILRYDSIGRQTHPHDYSRVPHEATVSDPHARRPEESREFFGPSLMLRSKLGAQIRLQILARRTSALGSLGRHVRRADLLLRDAASGAREQKEEDKNKDNQNDFGGILTPPIPPDRLFIRAKVGLRQTTLVIH